MPGTLGKIPAVLLATALLVLGSCKKDSPKPVAYAPMCTLTAVTSGYNHSNYEYYADGRLSRIVNLYKEPDTSWVQYFFYEGSRLIKDSFGNGNCNVHEYDQAGRMTVSRSYYSKVDGKSYPFSKDTLYYHEGDRPYKISYYNLSQGKFVVSGTSLRTYDSSGNVITDDYTSYSQGYSVRTTFTYDTRPNPYRNLGPADDYRYTNANNILQKTVSNDHTITTKYLYIFDGNGNVQRSMQDYGVSQQVLSDFTYRCK